jgi:ABC-type dipeptide/oligopeptide/nickel transport system permease component
VQPIIVQVVEEPARETTVVDVLVAAFGITGILTLVAVIAGLALGGLLVWIQRKRGRALDHTVQTLELAPPNRERS